ncbi:MULTISPECIES: hypothetical protein [unclassified Maridesulfovibrio]|uniref:hypothetical protein n=1 Tax=unclassified Maridesulfovibrio TaxID=2794999 RepID=UPI003B410A9F
MKQGAAVVGFLDFISWKNSVQEMKMKSIAAAMPNFMRHLCFCGFYRPVMFVMKMLIMMFGIVRIVGRGVNPATIINMGYENALVVVYEAIGPCTTAVVTALSIRCY